MNAHDVDQDGPGIKPRKRRSHEIDPWYKRYARDFHEGTRELTLEERGAYSDIIDLIFMHDGPIRDDPKWIAHKLCVDVRKWKALRKRLFTAGKLYITPQGIHNARAQEVLSERDALRAKLGRRGGSEGDVPADLFGNFNDFNGRGSTRSATSDRSDQSESKREDHRSFKPVVIDGGQSNPTRFHDVSEQALDEVRRIAPSWDRQALRKKFLDWPESRNAVDLDKAFLGWVRKFTKGKVA